MIPPPRFGLLLKGKKWIGIEKMLNLISLITAKWCQCYKHFKKIINHYVIIVEFDFSILSELIQITSSKMDFALFFFCCCHFILPVLQSSINFSFTSFAGKVSEYISICHIKIQCALSYAGQNSESDQTKINVKQIVIDWIVCTHFEFIKQWPKRKNVR